MIEVTELLPLGCVGKNIGLVNLYAVASSNASAVSGAPRSALILLEILGLFEDVFVDLVAVDGWVAVFGQQHD